MELRELIRSLLPPIFLDAVRAFRKPPIPIFTEFPSWSSAKAAAQPYATNLEAAEALALAIRSGAADPGWAFMPAMAGIFLSVEPVDVVDFGGGLGNAYLALSRCIPSRIRSWTVIELGPLCQYGNAKIADGKLKFIDSPSAAPRCDMLFCSGSLQYVDDPYEMLKTLIELTNPSIIVFENLSIDKEDKFALQRFSADGMAYRFAYRSMTDDKMGAVLSPRFSLIRQIKYRPDNSAFIPETYCARLYQARGLTADADASS